MEEIRCSGSVEQQIEDCQQHTDTTRQYKVRYRQLHLCSDKWHWIGREGNIPQAHMYVGNQLALMEITLY